MARPKSIRVPRFCKYCGNQVTGTRAVYCCIQCANKDKHTQHAVFEERRCVWCLAIFEISLTAKNRKRNGIFCSRSCFQAHIKMCGHEHASRQAWQRYAKQCERKPKQKKTEQEKKELANYKALLYGIEQHKARAVQTTCRGCGVLFCRLYGHKAKVCSEECLREFERIERARYKKRFGGNNQRRARKRGARAESVDVYFVFARDKWRCRLCNVKCRRSARGSISPDAPELDHIVPLSKGGDHTYQNVQLLCRACNSKKGANTIGQLLLAV